MGGGKRSGDASLRISIKGEKNASKSTKICFRTWGGEVHGDISAGFRGTKKGAGPPANAKKATSKRGRVSSQTAENARSRDRKNKTNAGKEKRRVKVGRGFGGLRKPPSKEIDRPLESKKNKKDEAGGRRDIFPGHTQLGSLQTKTHREKRRGRAGSCFFRKRRTTEGTIKRVQESQRPFLLLIPGGPE